MNVSRPIRIAQVLVVLWFCGVGVLAQNARTPRFEDYPVTEIFTGTPATPILSTPEERRFRTMIRQGVRNGWGVLRDGKEQAGPNFAGRYIAIWWGCGTGCRMMVFADAQTGQIEYPPLSFGRLGTQQITLPNLGLGSADIKFQRTSRLVVMKACGPGPYNRDMPCFTYYFLWQDKQWSLLRRVRLEEYDP